MPRLAAVFITMTVLSTTAAAQSALVVSQNKCALDKQTQIRQMTDSVFIPIAQELVNEGKLHAVGSAYHAWGDEWNVVIWYTAPNVTTFLTSFNELISRLNQRHPTFLTQILASCSEHKDSFYTQGRVTTPAATPTTPRRQ
jgi:hypothetical protein